MASIVCALLALAVTLPAGLPLEIAGLDIGSKLLSPPKVLSEMAEGNLQLNMTPNVFRNKEGHDDVVDLDAPLDQQQTLLWHNLLKGVLEDVDQLDDTVFTEEEENVTNRNDIPEVVDCYGLPMPISRALRFLFRTDRKETVNTRYFLSTRKHRDRVELKHDDPDFDLASTDFDPRRSKTVFIVHGFMSNGEMEWIKNLVEAMLDKEDANVVAVDWSGGGGSWMYWRAVANTRVTGVEVTNLIRKLIMAGLETKSIHLIGHSLGAHICSYIGASLGGVGRITGLDPAQPCFQADIPEIRLDPSDADFIDVIHTNGRLLEKVGLGLPEPIGHVDFYPNGGAKQPGCSRKRNKFLLPVTSLIVSRIEKSICSHGRSYMLFIESIKMARKCAFWGHRWDRNESDAEAAVQAPCNAANCTAMGIEAELFPARGTFYVVTQANTPYCIENPKAANEMITSLYNFYSPKEGDE
jgi:pimeloyl-ACP methyl ester carboxylesterase